MDIPNKLFIVEEQGALIVNYDKNDASNMEFISKDALLNWIKENRRTLMLSPMSEQTSRKILAYNLLERKLNNI